jgi:hypothetical protein
MRSSKVIVIGSLFLVLALAGSAMAANGYYLCSIDKIGTGWNNVYIWFTSENGDFTGSLKTRGNPIDQNKIMATALTAMTLGAQVNIVMDLELDPPIVYGIYMNKLP